MGGFRPIRFAPGGGWHYFDGMNWKLHLGCLAIISTCLGQGALAQESPPQSWVPDVLHLPDDAQVLTDRAIGESLRMFSFATHADVDALLRGWEADLREAGYSVLQAQADVLDRVIAFSGQGINNAQIVVAPASGSTRRIVAFDATLD